MTRDRLDVEPNDAEQLREIHLISEVIIACSGCAEERLPHDALDDLLGVTAHHQATGNGSRSVPAS